MKFSCVKIADEVVVGKSPPSKKLLLKGGDLENRDLKQTTTATATKTPQNKRFNEQNNSCARAL